MWMLLWNGVTCQLQQQQQHPNASDALEHRSEADIVYALSHENDVHEPPLYNHRQRDGVDECGGTFRDHQVLLKSPNYPRPYPNGLSCEYSFYSPFVCTSEFHIQFLDFQLEPSLTCAKDRLTIGSRTHRIDTLCGQVIGIMKYKVLDGILRINFTSDATVESGGFKLLVTRLPCEQNDGGDKVAALGVKSTKALAATTTTTNATSTATEPTVYVLPLSPTRPPPPTVVTSTTTAAPSPQPPIDQSSAKSQSFEFRSNAGPPIAAEPLCAHSPQIHYQQQPQHTNVNQLARQPFNVAVSRPLLPNCCRRVYNQPRFTLASAGFPGSANYLNDCAFYVERAHANVCRLRVEFKYLNLGERRGYQCANSFVEIDGQQFCGCATGLVHYAQWGADRKAIRFVNWPIYADLQGFVLSVVQEECPRRLQRRAPIGWQLAAQPRQNYLSHRYDPRRCSYDYVGWLLRSQPKLVSHAHAICHAT